ncbi:hypothetical protein D3C81_2333550 [compost metagenome]
MSLGPQQAAVPFCKKLLKLFFCQTPSPAWRKGKRYGGNLGIGSGRFLLRLFYRYRPLFVRCFT